MHWIIFLSQKFTALVADLGLVPEKQIFVLDVVGISVLAVVHVPVFLVRKE